MKKAIIIIMVSWFFMANSWSGLGGFKPKYQRPLLYGPFKDKATCEDIRRQVVPLTECWEA